MRTILVTGGTSGIGQATINRFTADGDRVINLDVADANDPGVPQVQCDLSDPAAIDSAINMLPDVIDGVVHVAGVAPGAVVPEMVVAINFLGMRYLQEQLGSRISENGKVVIVASSIGRDWQDNRLQVDAMLDTPDFAAGLGWLHEHASEWTDQAYKFSKQCAVAYTYRAVGQLKAKGINVNCVNPGIVETQLSPWFRDLVGEERYDHINQAVGRAGKPEDIAGVIRFLMSTDADWVNGVEFQVDGGYRAGVTGGWIDVLPL